MKKYITIVIAVAALLSASAQPKMMRQHIDQEIRNITVNNNTVVRLEKDTCNYVAYLCEQSEEVSSLRDLVEVKGTTLTTTEAAKDKTIIVGTTATNAELSIEEDAIVIHDGETYTCGSHWTSLRNTERSITETKTERDFTGLKKYGPSSRIYWDFNFGWTNFALKGKGLISRGATDDVTKFSYGDEAFSLGYSIYKDDHFAIGVGLGYKLSSYTFGDPYVTATTSEGGYTLEAPGLPYGASSEWETTLTNQSITFPIHFQYYPIADDHAFNLKLDLIPSFCFMSTLDQQYKSTNGNVTTQNRTTTKLAHNIFNCNLRFGINYGLIGAYVETSLLPINSYMKLGSSLHNNTFQNGLPYHVALGLTFRFADFD